MSIRAWVSAGTVLLLGLIIFFARHDIEHAWHLMEHINLLILVLLIPLQVFVYYAAGKMIFSYLQAKDPGNHMSWAIQARMALEMNFVNHVLPSGGVSGISYMTWRLGKYGISPGRATVAQIIRYVMGFASFITLLLISLVFMTLDGNVNRWTLFLSGLVVFLMVGSTLGVMFLASSQQRAIACAHFVTRTGNRLVRFVTFGRKRSAVDRDRIVHFLLEMHDEYVKLVSERQLLIKPYLWGLAFNAGDIMLFVITFWALGFFFDPAPVVIAYGLASMVGFALVTPGGTGGYEAIMVAFLVTAGIHFGAAFAAVLITRVIVLIGTIGLGYIFYQQALIRHGKSRS